MLVLTRKNDECIYIGSQIKIRVIQCEDGRVKLGIDAPSNIKIHREEVFAQIREENKKAAGINKSSNADLSILNQL